MKNNEYKLTIGWLYPQLMSTYGDKGNIIVLQKRCEWRGIAVDILSIDETTTDEKLQKIDILFGGGAQDREQGIVIHHLRKKKKIIAHKIDDMMPALFVCGAPQLLGNYYEPAQGKKIEGLGIFDMYSQHPGVGEQRLIGNIVAEILWENFSPSPSGLARDEATYLPAGRPQKYIVGFENHGGRTYLGGNAKPFAKVLKGNGNNGEDGTEGVVYKNAIGSYLHGPLLPKNPEIADWLIHTALEIKYNKEVTLETLDTSLEEKAKTAIANRLNFGV